MRRVVLCMFFALFLPSSFAYGLGKTISRGEKVDIGKKLVKGKYNLVEFSANWWGSCRAIKPQVEATVKKAKDLVLLNINLDKRKFDVAGQYKVSSIPYFMLYGPKGKLLGKGGSGFFRKKVKNWKAPKQKASTIPKIKKISKGEKVDIKKHLVKGHYTVIEFYADWWGACRRIGPQVEAKIKKTKGLFLRKINIKNWSSPVSKQYKLEGVPHFMIFDPKGKLLKKGFNVYKDILKWKRPTKKSSNPKKNK